MARITISDEELESIVQENVRDLEGFLDLDYPVDIRLGSASMSISKLLELKQGDLVALNRPSSAYVEVVVGDVGIGEAEVLARKKGTAARLVRIGDWS